MKFLTKLLLVVVLVAAASAAYGWYAIEKPYGIYPAEGVFVFRGQPTIVFLTVCSRKVNVCWILLLFMPP